MAGPAAFTPAPTTTIVAQQPLSVGVHTAPSFDPIEVLPKRAQDRLRKLRDRASDAHAVCVPHAELQEATALKQDADRALRRLTSHRQDGGHELPAHDGRVAAAEKQLAKVSGDLMRLRERSEKRAREWEAASAALANAERWLKVGKPSGVLLHDYEGPELEPKLLKGERGLLDAIENRRRRARELRADLARISAAPFPSAHARAKIRQEVEALAQRGEPVVSDVLEHDNRLIWPTMSLTSRVFNAQPGAVAYHEAVDVVGLVCWLHRDALLAKLDKLIGEEADDKAALSGTDRELRSAEVSADLLAVERTESEMVFKAWSEGLQIEHRSDIDPRALLGIALVTALRENETLETSPGYSWPWRR